MREGRNIRGTIAFQAELVGPSDARGAGCSTRTRPGRPYTAFR